MHTRRTACAAILVAALTAGCSSASDDTKPAEPSKPTPTVTKTIDQEAARAACVEAWAQTISSRPADFDPDTDTDPEPAACKGLPQDDWNDRYMDGVLESNKRARESLDACIEDPACTSAPIG